MMVQWDNFFRKIRAENCLSKLGLVLVVGWWMVMLCLKVGHAEARLMYSVSQLKNIIFKNWTPMPVVTRFLRSKGKPHVLK